MLICAITKGHIMSHKESSFMHALTILQANELVILIIHMIKGKGWVKGGHMTSYAPCDSPNQHSNFTFFQNVNLT